MSMTLSDIQGYSSRFEHTVTDSTFTTTVLANMAGQHLYAMHDWSFRVRRSATVNFVANQTYALLPADFNGIVSIQINGLTQEIVQTTLQQVLDIRSRGILPSGFRWMVAVCWPDSDISQPFPAPILELAPTPSADASDVVLFYRKSWPTLVNSGDYAQVPWYCEPLYLAVLNAVTVGIVESTRTTIDQEIGKLKSGPVYQAAMRADGEEQDDYGPILNGVGMGPSDSDLGYLPWTAPTIT